MAQASHIQTNFTGGIYGANLAGHINAPRRENAVGDLQNLIPITQGPLVRRGGTRFSFETLPSIRGDESAKSALVRFEFNLEQAYVIEFSDQNIRFYRNNAVILVNEAIVVTATTNASAAIVTLTPGSGYLAAEEVIFTIPPTGMKGLDPARQFTNATGVFRLFGGPDMFNLQEADIEGGATNIDTSDTAKWGTFATPTTVARVFEIGSPYLEAEIFDSDGVLQLKFAQSADVLYITHNNHAPRALTRTDHDAWTLSPVLQLGEVVAVTTGPYLDIPVPVGADPFTVAVTAEVARLTTITLSSVNAINDGAGFVAAIDIGRPFRLRQATDGIFRNMVISAVASTTVATAFNFTSTDPVVVAAAEENFRIGAYSPIVSDDGAGFPAAVGFYQDRIVLASTPTQVQRLDLSVPGGYSPTVLTFTPTDFDGTVADDNAIALELPSGSINKIEWILEDESGLIVGTSTTEWLVRASSRSEVITPANANASRVTSRGSSSVQAIDAGKALLFVQRAKRKMIELGYIFADDRFNAPDMTILSSDILKTGLIGLVYQREPLSVVWGWRVDGVMTGFTYERDENVLAWHKHLLGGFSDSGQSLAPIVESMAVIPSADLSRDEPWMIVKRFVNGKTHRYIEYMTKEFDDETDQEDAIQMDSALVYDGSPATSFTGAYHLEGQIVQVYADGIHADDVTPVDGAFTIETAASKVTVGLKNTWFLETLEPEAGSLTGVSQGKIKQVLRLTARLRNTLGLRAGPDSSLVDEEQFANLQQIDAATPLFTGDVGLSFQGGGETGAKVFLTHDGPHPITIQALMLELAVQDP